jgi:hypothetical protein
MTDGSPWSSSHHRWPCTSWTTGPGYSSTVTGDFLFFISKSRYPSPEENLVKIEVSLTRVSDPH